MQRCWLAVRCPKVDVQLLSRHSGHSPNLDLTGQADAGTKFEPSKNKKHARMIAITVLLLPDVCPNSSIAFIKNQNLYVGIGHHPHYYRHFAATGQYYCSEFF